MKPRQEPIDGDLTHFTAYARFLVDTGRETRSPTSTTSTAASE